MSPSFPFLFWRLFSIVDADRVKKHLTALLVNVSTTSKEGWKDYQRTQYRLEQLIHNNPERFNVAFNKLISDLIALEKAADASVRD